MSSHPRISLILPCYNEAEHIHGSLHKIQDIMSYVYEPDEYEILLIDDLSTDQTREELKRYSAAPFRVLLNESNLGRGATVKRGLKASRGDIIGFMDIDCEVAEYYLPKFVRVVELGADMAIGLRTYKVTPSPYILFRHILSSIYRFFLQKIINCPVKDTEVGFKFFSKPLADAIQEYSRFDGWFWDTECVLLAQSWNCKFEEIPAAFMRSPFKSSTVKVFQDSFRYFRDLLKYLSFKRSGAYPTSLGSIVSKPQLKIP